MKIVAEEQCMCIMNNIRPRVNNTTLSMKDFVSMKFNVMYKL